MANGEDLWDFSQLLSSSEKTQRLVDLAIWNNKHEKITHLFGDGLLSTRHACCVGSRIVTFLNICGQPV